MLDYVVGMTLKRIDSLLSRDKRESNNFQSSCEPELPYGLSIGIFLNAAIRPDFPVEGVILLFPIALVDAIVFTIPEVGF